jgi:nitrite reductase/ring-hydroxylating ferredoxin subunit/uncharacterized membrane protein
MRVTASRDLSVSRSTATAQVLLDRLNELRNGGTVTTNALVQAMDHPVLDKVAEPLSDAIRGAYEAAGPIGQQAKNGLHGVWLRHPLHPVFTDVPIGAWTTALALDATANGDQGMRRAATFAIGVGLAGAAGAAVTGLTDWSETDGRARRTGLIHGLLNITATALFASAFALRRRSHHGGRKCAWTGYAIALGAAYLGGDLVYGQRIGVTHAEADPPDEFAAAMDSAALADNTMARARVGDTDILLVRQHGRVCALAHSCSHLGGPLSEGTLKDGSVVCPWHGSEFSLEDGSVINGPATLNQPCLDVREQNGRIEVRRPA